MTIPAPGLFSSKDVADLKELLGTLNDSASANGTTFARLTELLGRITTARSAKIDNLDASISSRAPASTALSTATWTAARAALLDRLDAAISSRASAADYTAARALKLDNLDVLISSRAPANTALVKPTSTQVSYAGTVQTNTKLNITGSGYLVALTNGNTSAAYTFSVQIDGSIPLNFKLDANSSVGLFMRFELSLIVKTSDTNNNITAIVQLD